MLLFLAVVVVISVRSCSVETVNTKTETKIIQDTNTKIVKREPVEIEGKPTIIYRDRFIKVYIDSTTKDTIKTEQEAFTATLDTTINRTDVHLEYLYPEALFRVNIQFKPDSIQVINTTIEKTIYIEPSWYEKPLFVSSITAGVLVSIFAITR